MCSSSAVKALTSGIQGLAQRAYDVTPSVNEETGLGLGAYFDPHVATKDAFNRYQADQKSKQQQDEETPLDEQGEPIPNPLLGRLASGRRTQGQGQGIGANILTSGAGVSGKARTKRKTLLG